MPTYINPYLNNVTTTSKYYQLNDGLVYFYWSGAIIVDLNGSKGPNISGRDVFWFDIENNTLRTMGHSCSRNSLVKTVYNAQICGGSSINYLCNKNEGLDYTSGRYCAALIEKDGWKISKDYPW